MVHNKGVSFILTGMEDRSRGREPWAPGTITAPSYLPASEIATLQEQLLTSEAAVQSLQAAVRQRDELIRQLLPRAELLQDICRRRPLLAGLLATLVEAERLGPLPASDPSHVLPGGPSSPLANSTGEEEDRDHRQPALFGTTV